jgi:hypothetical protein
MKRILLLSLSAGMTALLFSSYSGGPFNGGAGNRTGSAGSVASCSSTSTGCHATSSANTLCSLVVQTQTGGAVTAYTPGVTYKVLVGGGTLGTGFPKYGFQVSAVKQSNTNTQAGTFAATTSNVSVHSFSGPGPAPIQLVEHNTPHVGTATGPGMLYTSSFDWTAPAAGTGGVRFYGMLNAVNDNDTSTGDQPSIGATLNLPEGSVGVATVKNEAVTVYPNPVNGSLNLKLDIAAKTCSVHILNFTGSVVAAMEVPVVNGELSVNTRQLKPGNYYVVAQHGNSKWGSSFVKQ